MRRSSNWGNLLVAFAVAAVLLAPAALAQNPTGTLTGSVTGPDGAGLPGVTVTATSPNLQGARVAVTGGNGSYKLAFLPPGEYQVTYELDGFATITRAVKLSAAVQTRSDIQMQLATVAEEIVVTGQQAAISENNTGSSTYTQDEIEKLPVSRALDSAVALAPGTHQTGPGGNVTIAGAMSFENLWTINGVVINENVRGQELPLYIEDALQETTTQVSGVSAEYGRFQGGVINAITKSGGNEFSGSLRANLTNDDWVARTPLSADAVDDINETYEATLGGYLWKDHLWFFGAGRDSSTTASASLPLTGIAVAQGVDQQRFEGKLTATIADAHTFVGTYLEIDQTAKGTYFSGNIDDDGVTDREDPQEIKSINYTGILTPSFFVEAQYSERDFQISKGGGAKSNTLLDGTLLRTRQGGFRYYTPTFCGVCEQEERNNEDLLAKGSWFLSTENAGTHDIVFGYDTFTDIRFSVNHQTGSDFTVWDSDFVIDGTDIFPMFYPVGNAAGQPATWIGWWAVFNLENAQPTNFETNSYYVNDRWQLNENWAFNLGLRYDETSGTDGGGNNVLDDNKWSPRLGATWDIQGDGEWVAHASVGTYVAAPANTIADSTSTGGAIGLFLSQYGGPIVNAGCTGAADCVPTRDALETLFNWYLANGGTTDLNGDLSNLPNLISVSIPGATSIIPQTIISPSADEYTIGMTKRLGNKGLIRADIVYRDYSDFYSNRTDLTTGTVQTATGEVDRTIVGNFGDSVLEREYRGLHLQGRYRVNDRLTLSGNYTLSEAKGNFEGENTTSGPLTTSPNNYPEYFQNSWAYPVGNLDSDQTHKLRVWAIYDIIDTEHNSLSVSLLQNYFSGQHYSLFANIEAEDYVTNPGYVTPPSGSGIPDYFFSDKGEFTYDNITRTDLAINYSFLWNAFNRQIEVFVQPEVLNLFNEQGLVDFDTRIRTADTANTSTACNGAPCQPFNPFTETPVEGVNWAKRDTFGDPLEEADYQLARTFRLSVGFRF
jgi:outer membrane receptor protein involved in Fe transport